ncbi:MAG: amidohydrolase family protein, partial [Ilumatobacter sp.]|nr:amidohydrolase family protein [Ilumatobacter sp.]
MHDLVIRNGLVVDGTGADPRPNCSIAIDGEVVTAIGADGEIGPGHREIDATGLLVTPGFVDIHTHYDGQATWDGDKLLFERPRWLVRPGDLVSVDQSGGLVRPGVY